MTRKIYLNGHIDVPTDRIAAVTEGLADHIALTRAEPGCISFEVTPSDTIAGRFMVSEVFMDKASFDAHQERTKNSPWFETTKGLPRDYTIKTGNET